MICSWHIFHSIRKIKGNNLKTKISMGPLLQPQRNFACIFRIIVVKLLDVSRNKFIHCQLIRIRLLTYWTNQMCVDYACLQHKFIDSFFFFLIGIEFDHMEWIYSAFTEQMRDFTFCRFVVPPNWIATLLHQVAMLAHYIISWFRGVPAKLKSAFQNWQCVFVCVCIMTTR